MKIVAKVMYLSLPVHYTLILNIGLYYCTLFQPPPHPLPREYKYVLPNASTTQHFKQTLFVYGYL